ncbi:carbohydrate-binding domain-containing protein [Anaerocolumna xylanovorans]|uniref:Carbohydrate-binding domain-containing protein n=1 Tax=Anaerocolumna xylanovorans DSM 12503 TaxID=1121345 RepID=A0A1M7XZP0_9FIRM|nr:carbohydrate-binding domain-containing protein [Anaerocolumna xylanovorans]SHO44631.1 protein of unknown function [Anaerocolumna xylanovorans DSM 12503]
MGIRPKLKKGLCLFLILSLFLFTGCTDKKDNSSSESAAGTQDKTTADTSTNTKTATVSTVKQTTGEYSDNDLDASWDEASAIKMTFDKQNITSSDGSVTIKDNTAAIKKAGTYVLSGTLTDGSVIVDAGDDDNVKLVLNNTDMTSSTTAPLYIKNAKNVYLTLAESSVNTITDASKYVYADDTTDEPSAAIFSKTDLTINGSGALNVNGNYNNAIQSKDDLKIINGTLTVTSVDDGIIGKDSISIKGGTITVNSTGDAIKSTNTEDTSKGFIIIDGGTYNITSGTDGFQAETSLIVNDGSFNVTTNGGSANAAPKAQDDFGDGFGKKPDQNSSDSAATDSSATSTEEESSSAKAFKSASVLTINGGTFTVDSSDDSFHSNGTLTVTDGTFTISSGDDAMHADSELTLSVDKLDIKKSYEGIESANITINSGDITLTSSDDGINASGGSESSSAASNDRGGFESNGNAVLTINGGTITMNADGDGLDANGSITMNDGTIYLSGPTNNGNGPLDYDTAFTMNGGTLIAAGSSGMAQAPSDGSKQPSVAYVFDSAQTGGTKISLADTDGKEMISYTPEKNYQYVLISSPLLEKNKKYTLSSNGSLVYTFTISDTVNANTTLQTTGGPGGFGGGNGGGRGQGSNGSPNGKFGGNTPPDMPNGSDSGTDGGTSNNTDSGSGT